MLQHPIREQLDSCKLEFTTSLGLLSRSLDHLTSENGEEKLEEFKNKVVPCWVAGARELLKIKLRLRSFMNGSSLGGVSRYFGFENSLLDSLSLAESVKSEIDNGVESVFNLSDPVLKMIHATYVSDSTYESPSFRAAAFAHGSQGDKGGLLGFVSHAICLLYTSPSPRDS